METQDLGSPMLGYRLIGPDPLPATRVYSLVVSVIPHAGLLTFALADPASHFRLVETVVNFIFAGSLIVSIAAILYYTKRRRNFLAISGIAIHALWLIGIAVIALREFRFH